METKIKLAIEEYQCIGCSLGSDVSCFKPYGAGLGCGNHNAGTFIPGIGSIFLGMPKGFNRLGEQSSLKPAIFETFNDKGEYDMFNIPTWKHLTEEGHTLVRGLRPRKNESFLHIFLEDCMDKIDCLEITQVDIANMD